VAEFSGQSFVQPSAKLQRSSNLYSRFVWSSLIYSVYFHFEVFVVFAQFFANYGQRFQTAGGFFVSDHFLLTVGAVHMSSHCLCDYECIPVVNQFLFAYSEILVRMFQQLQSLPVALVVSD